MLADPGSSRPHRLHAGIRERYRVELIKVQCFRYIKPTRIWRALRKTASTALHPASLSRLVRRLGFSRQKARPSLARAVPQRVQQDAVGNAARISHPVAWLVMNAQIVAVHQLAHSIPIGGVEAHGCPDAILLADHAGAYAGRKLAQRLLVDEQGELQPIGRRSSRGPMSMPNSTLPIWLPSMSRIGAMPKRAGPVRANSGGPRTMKMGTIPTL